LMIRRFCPCNLLRSIKLVALKAEELTARHKIPYVDCISAALAVEQRDSLVTADRDFEKLGRQFPILWISRP
jgi:predicted nucleic acid-binding protein